MDALPRLHLQLAHALEETKQGDPERLAMHFQEAREFQKAAEYYAQAAYSSAQSFAFDRAAEMYRRAIEFASPDHPRRREWETRLGDALANAGRGAEAARIYLEAAHGAPASVSRDLTRRAGFQYCITGHLDEGRKAFRSVLREIGMSLPRTRLGTLLQLLWYRVRLRWRGLEFQRRPPHEMTEEQRQELDITESVAMGSSTNSPWHGALFQTRHLLLAAASGDPVRVALAISWEAGYSSMEGGRHWPRTARLLQAARSLAEETQDAHAAGSSALAFGIAEFLSGRYARALDHNLRAEQIFRERCTGVTWEQDTAQVFGLWSLFYMGRIADLRTRYNVAFQEARERGDRYLMTTLGTQVGTLLYLADDDGPGARKALEELMSRWTNDGFTLQHHNEFFARELIDLYENRLDLALARLEAVRTRYHLSLLTGIQHIRIDLAQLSARLFLEAACRDPRGSSKWLRRARECVRDLRRERMPYSDALAKYIEANLALATELCAPAGPQRSSISLLRASARSLAEVDLEMLSNATQWQIGRLDSLGLGDDRLGNPGSESVDPRPAPAGEACQWFAAQGVVAPERLLRAVSLTFLGVETDGVTA